LIRISLPLDGPDIRGMKAAADLAPPQQQAGAGALPRASGSMNVLMFCSRVSLPYRVMQCIAPAGAVVHVLGDGGSTGLRYSRYCRSFTRLRRAITGERDPDLADEINNAVCQRGIEMVIPAGHVPTRALVANRDMVQADCFPLPEPKLFDLLNNKWRFTQLCLSNGIPCPRSLLFADRAELTARLQDGALRLPAVAKPLSEDGGRGVLKLATSDWRTQIKRIEYAPIIVQEFIEGEDVGACVYCEGGEIKCFIANTFRRGIYTTFEDPLLYDAVSRILGPLEVDGVFHFDLRRTSQRRIYFLECNPRFNFKINLAMVAGLNFVRCGLYRNEGVPSAARHGTQVKRPWALAYSLARPWAINQRDLALLWSLLSDPICFLRESLRVDWDA
jgi:hypothetical protein